MRSMIKLLGFTGLTVVIAFNLMFALSVALIIVSNANWIYLVPWLVGTGAMLIGLIWLFIHGANWVVK